MRLGQIVVAVIGLSIGASCAPSPAAPRPIGEEPKASTPTPTSIVRVWSPRDQEHEVGFGTANAIKMKLLSLERTNRSELVRDPLELDENAEFLVATIQYRSTQGGTHAINSTGDFYVDGARRVSPLPAATLRDPDEMLGGSVPLNQQITGIVVFPVRAGEEFRKLVYTAGRAPKEIDIGEGGAAIKRAVPTSALAIATRTALRAEQTVTASQMAAATATVEAASAEAISDYLDNAAVYRATEQYGLALVMLEEAIAMKPDYRPAQALRGEVAAEATSQVARHEQAISDAEAARAAQAAQAAAAAEAAARESRRIPGLAAVDVYGNLRNRGFRCTGPTLMAAGDATWDCTSRSGGAEMEVHIWGRSATDLWLVNAIIWGSPTNQQATDFLGFIATTPYEGSEPNRARQWVVNELPRAGQGRVANMTIGGAKFSLFGPQTSRSLQISALNLE